MNLKGAFHFRAFFLCLFKTFLYYFATFVSHIAFIILYCRRKQKQL